MPLSDHERKLLEQLETELTAGTPRPTHPPRVWPRFQSSSLGAVAAVGGVLAGVAIVTFGVGVAGNLGTVLGVFGYLVTVGCCEVGVNTIRDARHHHRLRQGPAGGSAAPPEAHA